MIILSIDLKMIDQARCKKVTRKNGQAATFCELVMFETPNSPYGEYALKQGVTKEERQQRVEMPIIGNGKNVGSGNTNRQQSERVAETTVAADDEIPF